ncbi:MAG: protein jag [Christensenellaceae bacterium]|jgi:spoIIIJ-associated protein|nr:protein jag [Christensenellaceae bacterium]
MSKEKGFIFKGATVEDAIASGLAELGLSESDAEINIISSGGFLTKASVSITPKNTEEQIESDTLETETVLLESVSDEMPLEISPKEMEEICRQAQIDSCTFIDELLLKMGLACSVESNIDSTGVNISIQGSDAGAIIGFRGEVLDSIQYYALVIANKGAKSFVRVQVDAGNYRAKREEALTNLAIRLAHRVAKSGRKTELEPMNPFERRIIHAALANDKFVKTESEGEGRYRHVVIIPNNTNVRRPYNDERHGGNYRDNSYRNDKYVSNKSDDSSNYNRKDFSADTTKSDTQYSYGGGDFRKKGPNKTRSFGNNDRRF